MLNIALIGKGKFGRNYFRLLKNMPGVRLSAIVTKSSNNLLQILKDPAIHAVVIATPPVTHFEIVKIALESDKHVLVEKPMTLRTSECRKLKTIVKKSNRVFMVGFQYLYNDYIVNFKKEIDRNVFGKLIEISWEHFQSPVRYDVNSFWDDAPHPLSIFQYFFNPRRIVKKSFKNSGKNKTSATIQFDRGPLLHIQITWTAPKKVRKLRIIGEKKMVTFDETLKKNRLQGAKEPLRKELDYFIYCIKNKKTPLTNIDFGSMVTNWLEKISPSN